MSGNNDGLNFAGWMIGLSIALPALIILLCCVGLPLIGAVTGQ